MKKFITLIGMPGSGKSFLGKRIAGALRLSFTDTDELLMSLISRPLSHLSKRRDAFLTLETQIVCSLENVQGVVSTGGSVVLSRKAMEFLKERSLIVHITASLITIKRRVGNLVDRGVIHNEGQTIEDIYRERIPLYRKWADLEISNDSNSTTNVYTT